MNLNKFAKDSYEVAKIRQSAKGVINAETLLKHCATEVVEAMEAYVQYRQPYDIGGAVNVEKFARRKNDFIGELADIINCVLILAAHEEIDMEEALKSCLEKNRKRAEEGK